MNQFHPLADIFPLMEGRDFEELCDSIKSHGQLEPIWLVAAEPPAIEGLILDGRNRYRACQRLGIAPTFEWYTGNDPLSFVVNLNLHRRHLNEAQRSAVAAMISNMAQGERTDLQPSANLPKVSQARAAEMLNVSERTVRAAVVVKNDGAPELFKALQSGRVSTSAAADVATLPKTQQAEVVARGEKEIVAAAKAIRVARAAKKKAERIENVKRQAAEIAAATPVAPSGLFHVISIDPPWPYDDGKSAETYDPNGRRAANPYPEMSLEDIRNLVIPAADDCVLWLWTTHKFMRHSFDLLDAWGFADKAILTWAKDRMGLGRWLRSQSEFCIMAVRGSPVINLTNQTTVLHGPLREHSRKPDEFYALVDSLCVGRKLDYFSRQPRDGWEQFGNDTERFCE